MSRLCTRCGTSLTAEEQRYYENACDDCEREWNDRIEAWHHGGQDAELDKAYGESAGRVH